MGFYILPTEDDKEALTCQNKRYVRTKKRKVSVKKWSIPHLGLRGLHHKERRKELLSVNHLKKYTVYGTGMSIILSLYPKFFGYSLGGYSHRERCRAPDRKKSTEEGCEVAMKNQLENT
jgi:hypothetical protein